ncbi:LLM class flavin-dependent oxidoreductase [Novosphingobium lentum]|uniref:LLM class flavin-dependent oxidoreductase n=1 Tax=Novosphingobium lentum TaxID=145287 RepID=UPI0012EE0355|nr:LLM class flavin-dependent oxidoreductase [Novosphingobium lentum]
MELGIYTFGDLVTDPITGRKTTPVERMRQMIEMARLADDAGLDIIGVGEHHTLRYVNSATATQIAAMAAVTKRIRLTSASTSLGTADPVRTFQEFATADLVSEGRVEIIFGRGAFTENFPLFGYDLKDYDALFIEKLQLFDLLNRNERVSWSGRFRPPLVDAEIAPRPAQAVLPVSIGAGRVETVTRAAQMGYALAIPMVGGDLRDYAEVAQAYHRAIGPNAPKRHLAAFAHLHVSASERDTQVGFYPYYSAYLEPLFRGPMPPKIYAQMLSPMGALVAGSPQQVVDKLSLMREMMGITRFLGQADVGGLPFAAVMKGIELYATKVAPALRERRAP